MVLGFRQRVFRVQGLALSVVWGFRIQGATATATAVADNAHTAAATTTISKSKTQLAQQTIPLHRLRQGCLSSTPPSPGHLAARASQWHYV